MAHTLSSQWPFRQSSLTSLLIAPPSLSSSFHLTLPLLFHPPLIILRPKKYQSNHVLRIKLETALTVSARSPRTSDANSIAHECSLLANEHWEQSHLSELFQRRILHRLYGFCLRAGLVRVHALVLQHTNSMQGMEMQWLQGLSRGMGNSLRCACEGKRGRECVNMCECVRETMSAEKEMHSS